MQLFPGASRLCLSVRRQSPPGAALQSTLSNLSRSLFPNPAWETRLDKIFETRNPHSEGICAFLLALAFIMPAFCFLAGLSQVHFAGLQLPLQ